MERPRIAVCDQDPDTAGWLHRWVADAVDLLPVTSGAAAAALLRRESIPVMIVGEHLIDMPGEHLVRALTERALTTVITIGVAPAPAPPGVFYRLDRDLQPEAVRLVIAQAVARATRRPDDLAELAEPAALHRLAAAARRIATQRSAADVMRALAEVGPALIDADRATCLCFDADGGQLWADADGDRPAIESPVAGVAGFAVRTGRALLVERASADPRFRAEVDDPAGTGDERLLAQPIVGPDGDVHAVMVIARAATGAPFGRREAAVIAAFATRVAPVLDAFALEARAVELAPPVAAGFRPEAVAAYQARRDEGAALDLAPRWARIAAGLLLAFVAAAIAYLCLARVDQHAAGPAVVLADGRQDLTASVGGTVAAVLVAPGQRVEAGQELVRLHDASEAADLEAIERDFEQRLVERLEHPDDEAAASALAALVSRRQRAEREVAARILRAPAAGTVTDVVVRAGQLVGPGQQVLSVISGEGGATVLAFLPAGQAPLVRPGMTLRLELGGHAGAYQRMVIDTVATDASGPAMARQLLGDQLADAVPMAGPTIMVRGRVPSGYFAAGGRRYAYRHGMTGRAEVRVRSERMITALVPGLREVVADDYE